MLTWEEFLPGDQGEVKIDKILMINMTPSQQVAFDDVIMAKAEAGFDIITHADVDSYIIQWKRRT